MIEGSPEILGVENTLWALFKPSGMPVERGSSFGL